MHKNATFCFQQILEASLPPPPKQPLNGRLPSISQTIQDEQDTWGIAEQILKRFSLMDAAYTWMRQG